MSSPAGESVKMALSALSDFHYDKLEIDLYRKATGDTELGLHIAGRNPSFYNGYPVEFNLSVTGRLDEVLHLNQLERSFSCRRTSENQAPIF